MKKPVETERSRRRRCQDPTSEEDASLKSAMATSEEDNVQKGVVFIDFNLFQLEEESKSTDQDAESVV